jgi:NADP-dependent 3-hydroxy acid dehydrogenase YdfG
LDGGEVHGVYWLPALDDEGPVAELEPDAWRHALDVRVRDLYRTMRRLTGQRPFLVTATRLGGYHGYDEAGATCPLGGGVTGFAKAYRAENPGAIVKAVDFAPSRRTAALADLLVAETLRDPGCVEVGYAGGRRWGVGLAERPFPAAGTAVAGDDGQGQEPLGPDAVVLVTGAAGSIVSAITADLAASGATFHLLDVTAAPDPADPDLRRYAQDPDGLATELAARLRERGERPTPVAIGRVLARLERSAAALAAVQAVERAGGTAHYHCVDLTDPIAVEKVMAEVRDTSGRVDVLLHAAGLEVSHALADKEPAEFDRVLAVKADGLHHLLHAARDLPLGTVVGFSSVAGRFGNAGQTDYSAANDLQCKIISNLRRSGRADGLAIDWTAWGGIGMATRGSIPTVMARAGVELLPAEAGVAWVRRELTTRTTAEGEVVVAGALGALAAGWHDTGGLDPAALPAAGATGGRAVRFDLHGGLVVEATLDPARVPFLDHHRIDGTAVLPGVLGLELFAEAAALLVPGYHVTGLSDVDFHAPVKFYRDEPRTLAVTALLRPDGAGLLAECRLETERSLPGAAGPQRTRHFTGTVRLAAAAPQPDSGAVEPVPAGTPALDPDQVYRLYFHGPAYRVVGSAWRHGDGAAAVLAADLPDQFAGTAAGPVLIGPRLVELCFQAAGLWEAGRAGRLALPYHITRLERYGEPVERPGLVATARPDGAGGFDCAVRDGAGAVVLRLSGYRTVPLPGPLPEDVAGPIRSVMAG